MSRRTNNLKRMKEAKKLRRLLRESVAQAEAEIMGYGEEQGSDVLGNNRTGTGSMIKGKHVADKAEVPRGVGQDLPLAALHLLAVIRNIPGNKQLTLSLGKNSKYEIEAHSDGSLGHDRAQESLFCAKLACGIMGSGLLIIRAFDRTRFATFTKPDGQVVEAQWEMLYGVFMRGGKWQPVPPDDLRDLFATCPCCGDKIPPKPGVDYCDLRRFIEDDPASANLGGWIRRILMAALRMGWTLSRYNRSKTVRKTKTNKEECR